jgi:hypothetical protein
LIKEGDSVRAWIKDFYTVIDGKVGTVDHIDDLGTIRIKFDDGKDPSMTPSFARVEKVMPPS